MEGWGRCSQTVAVNGFAEIDFDPQAAFAAEVHAAVPLVGEHLHQAGAGATATAATAVPETRPATASHWSGAMGTNALACSRAASAPPCAASAHRPIPVTHTNH